MTSRSFTCKAWTNHQTKTPWRRHNGHRKRLKQGEERESPMKGQFTVGGSKFVRQNFLVYQIFSILSNILGYCAKYAKKLLCKIGKKIIYTSVWHENKFIVSRGVGSPLPGGENFDSPPQFSPPWVFKN